MLADERFLESFSLTILFTGSMKQLTYFSLILFFLCTISCVDREWYFEETTEGNKGVAFWIDDYCVVKSNAHAYLNRDSLYIRVPIDHGIYNLIYINMPLEDLSSDQPITNLDITVKYKYKDMITPPTVDSEPEHSIVIKSLQNIKGEVSIRYFDMDERIISGSFNFVGERMFPDGTSKEVKVRKGNIDMKFNVSVED